MLSCACVLFDQHAGVTNVLALVPTFRAMADHDFLLLVHGESTDPTVDIFEREAAFLPTLASVIEAVPTLRIVLEHVSTAAGVQFVAERARKGSRLAATLTVQHLLLSRNALFAGGLNSSIYCLPILKHENDRRALWDALLGEGAEGSPFLFAGTDSAPHPRANKEKACGCAAGCFTAHASLELYTEAFETAAAERNIPTAVWQRRLERFLCEDGARFYGLPLNEPRAIVLDKQEWKVADEMPFGSAATVIPLRAGQTIKWRIRA
jgi:dihydroorotase